MPSSHGSGTTPVSMILLISYELLRYLLIIKSLEGALPLCVLEISLSISFDHRIQISSVSDKEKCGGRFSSCSGLEEFDFLR